MKMNRLNVFLGSVLAGILFACGGAPVQEVKIEEPTFKVSDAAPGGREAWLDNPNLYAEKSGLDVEKFHYFTGDAQSADKRMACEKAYADTVDDIGKQVAVYVDSAISRASSDATTSDTAGTSAASASSTETSRLSSQLTRANVGGSEKLKQYWEQRDYSNTGGAKSIFYCWVLTKVSKKDVAAMIVKAQTLRYKEDPGLKAKVETKLQNLGKDFDAYLKNQ